MERSKKEGKLRGRIRFLFCKYLQQQRQSRSSKFKICLPSAIRMPSKIMNASKRKQIVIFLDNDGTLSPIVKNPDEAFTSELIREAVRRVATYFSTAIISGQRLENVCKSPMDIKSIPLATVENNKYCLSIHFRYAKKVLEISPLIEWDKGMALKFLMKSVVRFTDREDVVSFYIGDDCTDEDAFKILRDRGQDFDIIVSKSPKETSASYSLEEPYEDLIYQSNHMP